LPIVAGGANLAVTDAAAPEAQTMTGTQVTLRLRNANFLENVLSKQSAKEPNYKLLARLGSIVPAFPSIAT
jgi:hypothetical protein